MINFRKQVEAKKSIHTPSMPDISEFVTTQEASQKLGLTVRAVSRLVTNKKLEGVKLGRMYLISRNSVKNYISKTKNMSKRDPRRKQITN